MGWKVRGTAPGPYPCTGNGHPTADRDPPRRGGNRPQDQIHNKQQAIRDSHFEGPWMGESFEKNLQQREGDMTTSQGESKGYKPPRPTGSSSVTELDPNTPKGSEAEVREGCYPGGERNKASSQYHGEPKLPRPMESVTDRSGKEEQGEKLDRDRSRGMQLKADLQYEEQTLKRQQGEVKERADKPSEKSWHRREERVGQKRMIPKPAQRGEERETSPRAKDENQTPRVQSAKGERWKENQGKINLHEEEGTQEEKATQRTAPKTLLKVALEGQEAETVAGQGVSNKGGMVLVSDGAKRTTLARLLGMDATVVVMPQGQLAEIVKRNIHKGNCKKAPRRRIARARQQGGIPKGIQHAGEMLQGERSPERQPGKDLWKRGRELQQRARSAAGTSSTDKQDSRRV